MKETALRERIFVALDLANEQALRDLLSQLDPKPLKVKIGYQLVYALGLARVFALLAELVPEAQVFLDLKLHDIPNTMAEGVQALKQYHQLGLKYLSVHASAGREALLRSQDATGGLFDLAAVSVLTSLEGSEYTAVFGSESSPEEKVLALAALVSSCGIGHLVCSGQELGRLRLACPSLVPITPGIRGGGVAVLGDDQRRSYTPREALGLSGGYLVIGRPIYGAADPCVAWRDLLV